jgi:hypothetical protein
LHHVLIQPVHGDNGKDSCQELLEEISLVVDIVKKEHPGEIAV